MTGFPLGFPPHATALKANARKINNAVEKYEKLQNYVALLLSFFYFKVISTIKFAIKISTIVLSATAHVLDRSRGT